MLEVMGVFVDVPDVWHVLLLEINVDALADPDQAVLVPAGEVQEIELGWAFRDQAPGLQRVWCWERRRIRQSTQRSPGFRSPKFRDWLPPIERPASARSTRSAFHRIFRLDERDETAEEVLVEDPERRCGGHRIGPVGRPPARGRWA